MAEMVPASRVPWDLRARALRTFSFPLSLLPVLVATATVARPGRWRWDVLAACMAGAALLHAAGNLLNDYFDFRSGADSLEGDAPERPGRLIVRGLVTPALVLRMALWCLALTALPLAWVAWRTGPMVLLPAAGGVAALYAYTGPPFCLKARALGEPLIFLAFGPLLMGGAALAQTGAWSADVLWLSVPVGMATTAVLAGNNLRDAAEDRAGGVRTSAHVLGVAGARILYLGLLLGSAAGVALWGVVGPGPVLLATAPITLVTVIPTTSAVVRGRRIADVDARTARYAAVLMAWTFVALLIGR